MAAQQAQASRQSLMEQLAQQRMSQQQARSQIAEQGYLQQRQIGQQTAARGLGSSGIRNLAGLQSQLAQSQSINQLAQQDANVQREAMYTGQDINRSLADSLRGAQLQYSQMESANQEQLYGQQRAEEQERSALMMELAQMAAEGADQGLIQNMLSLSNIDLNYLTEEQRSVLDSLGSIGIDVWGDTAFNAGYAEGYKPLDWDAAGRYMDPNYMSVEQLQQVAQGGEVTPTTKRKYTIGNDEFYGTPSEAAERVKKLYEGRQYIGKEILIEADKSGNIKFMVGGAPNRTYNEALEAVRRHSEIQNPTR